MLADRETALIADMTRRVFIVEDDEAVRDSLRMLLEAARFTTVGFATGEAFLRFHEVEPCDCVILDLNLPGKNGFDVLAALSELQATVPVVVVTGESTRLERAALADGAVAFLAKPVDGDDLLAVLERAIGPPR